MKGDGDRLGATVRRQFDDAIQIWTDSSVKVIDIRRQTIEADCPLLDYRMPSSMLICVYGGPADVWLNETLHSMERFGVFHGGKGTLLSIRPTGPRTGYYAVLYKPEEPPFYKTELKRLLLHVDPFRQLYGFSPRSPLFYVEQLRSMYERWPQATPLRRFYGKAMLYRIMYEIYEELEQNGIQPLRPDIVSLVRHYMDSHFRETVSLQTIADTFHVSSGHLTRLFKKQEGISPKEYLIRRRVEAARADLTETDATLREIACNCGFSDEFHLMKTFKSQFQMTPGDWRKMSSIRMRDPAIGKGETVPYPNKGLAWLDHLAGEGEGTMLGAHKSKTMVLAAALSLMVMLSACAPAASGTQPQGSNGVSNPSEAVQQTGTAQQTAAKTREFAHLGGKSVVPENPQRIVADWYYGELLALGVRPIGYPEYLLSEYPYRDSNGTVGFWESVEQIVELNPDLIISTWEDSYKQFSKIAPSVLLKLNEGVFEKMRVLGELINRKDEAEKWIASFESKQQAARKRLAEKLPPNTTVTILSVFQKDVKVHSNKNLGGDVLYNVLQMKPPKKVEEMFSTSSSWNLPVSFEALPEVAGTHIIFTAYDPEGTGKETLEQLEKSAVWQSLDAVKNNRVHKVKYYDLFFDDPIAIEHQMDMLTEMILK